MKRVMSGRERVLAAVHHAVPDRVPLDLQATTEAWAKLAGHFGTGDKETILTSLGVDMRYILPTERRKPRHYADGTYDGPWGNRLRRVANQTGSYEEVAYYPLDAAGTPDEIAAFTFPEPATCLDYSGLGVLCRDYDAYAIVGGYASVFYIPTQLRNMERILLDMAAAPEMVDALVDKALRYAIAYNEPLLAAGGGRIDFLHIADDYATQRGLLMSPDMWRRFFREPTRRLVEMAHSFGAKVLFHCCGAVYYLIQDLIDLGIEVLDPVQTSAADMEPARLKRAFGDRLAFHGGVNTQHTLPHGTVEDVRREAAELCEVLGHKGGYILTPCHMLQSDVPVENILALYEAARS